MFGAREPSHFLRPIVSGNYPTRQAFFDCSAYRTKEKGLYVDRFNGAAAMFVHRTSKRRDTVVGSDTYRTAADLFNKLDTFTPSRQRTVCWAHDLAYQLRISRALVELPALGWQLRKIVLERTAAWAQFTQDGRTLLFCDLRSFVPYDLARIADMVGLSEMWSLGSLAGPEHGGNKAQRRVKVISEAVTQLLAWCDTEQLGPFRPTGSGQSYAAFRKRFMTHRMLVHDDMTRIDHERKAMYTGRVEAWKHGKLSNGPFYEYDMHAAYCVIASCCEVPVMAVGEARQPNDRRLAQLLSKYHILADVTVETDVPCVPTGYGGRTIWPVGVFRSSLWSPELDIARTYAKEVRVHRAFLYRKAPALQAFAQWVLDNMDTANDQVPAVAQAMLKHWSRAMIGRLGLRYRSWSHWGTQPEPDLRLITYIDSDEHTSTEILIAGRDRLILTGMNEASESMPQIPSFIMSECRARLWRAMCAAKLENVVYMDTDSLIITKHGHKAPAQREFDHSGAMWNRKGEYATLDIRGPRNIEVGTTRRISGVPLGARQTAPLEFTAEVMRGIKESMRAGELDCVASLPHSYSMTTPDMRRRHVANHETQPFEVILNDQGA